MKNSPKGWASGRLSDFIQPRGEKVIPTNFPNLPFVRMDHVEAHTTRIIGSIPAQQMKSSASRFSKNDVLYGRLRPYLNKVAQPTFDGLASGEFIVFRGNEFIDSSFLRLRLNSRDFVSFATHLTEGDRPRVSFNQIGDFKLLLPPISEQRRIVEKIELLFDEIDRGVESLCAANRKISLYRQSLLKSAFQGQLTAKWRVKNSDKLKKTDTLLARIRKERDIHYKNILNDWEREVAVWRKLGEKGRKPTKPKQNNHTISQQIPDDVKPNPTVDWGLSQLGQLNVSVRDGPFGSKLKTRDYSDAGVRVIRLENIGFGKFIEEKRSYISKAKYNTLKEYSVLPGTIVVAAFISGSIRACLVPNDFPTSINKADCFAISVFGQQINRHFITYFLLSKQAFQQLERLIHGVGRPRINTTQLKELYIPVCSPAEQAEIVRILDARLKVVEALEAELDINVARADALRQSILKVAFAGQLVPQDPKDEPVSDFLDCIRVEQSKSTKGEEKSG